VTSPQLQTTSAALLMPLLAGWIATSPEIGIQRPVPRAPAEPPLVVTGGMLIDGTGAAPRFDQAIVIEGDRIARIEPMERTRIPREAQIIDAAGMTIMPGLISSNQHLQLNPLHNATAPGLTLDVLLRRWEESFARMPAVAWVYLMQGITSMRQTSGPAERLRPLKHAIDSGQISGPRVFLGGALIASRPHFELMMKRLGATAEVADWLRNHFAFKVIDDVDADTDVLLDPDFNYWKLLMSDEPFDGANDFTDQQVRFLIDKAHRHGKIVDVHCGGNNAGLRRMLAFDVDTLEHPFYGHEIIADDVIDGYVRKRVLVDTLLTEMVERAQRASDPHRFDESLYIMSLRPDEYRLLLDYRDRMLLSLKRPAGPGVPLGEGDEGLSFEEQQKQRLTSRENMRRFIKAGARFTTGTDTPGFLSFLQEDPFANEMMYMVELGMTPMQAIEASTLNGAAALGLQRDLGTVEAGKLADLIVVAGNPLQDMRAMKRVHAVIKAGVRYK
jgi:imidazolonepropionase-like amidohydrolase